jgi:dUTPase
MGMFDIVNIDEAKMSKYMTEDYIINKYDRLVQICAPGLVPIIVEVVDKVEELGEKTERGSGGFGSTGR